MKYQVDFYEESDLIFSHAYISLDYALLAIHNWCAEYDLSLDHHCSISVFIDKGATA